MNQFEEGRRFARTISIIRPEHRGCALYVADTLLIMTESQRQFGLSEDPAAPQIDRDRAVCSLRTLLVDEDSQ